MAAPIVGGVRNVAFVGPHHGGKTTLVEALLAHAGAIPRKGAVTDGTATTNHDSESIAHQMSVAPAFAHLQVGDIRVNLIDCPGAVDFFEETKFVLLAADAAIIVVEADPNRLPLVESLVEYVERMRMPHCFVINRMDRPGADFPTTYARLREKFGVHVVAEQAPIGQGDSFAGYVNVVSMQAFKYGADGKAAPTALPGNAEDKTHEQLLEALADFDDHLMEEILEGTEPPLEEVERDLSVDVSADKIVPVVIASGIRGCGVPELLDLIVRQFPDGAHVERTAEDGAKVTPSESGPVIAQVCKTFVHPQSGKLSVARIFSGTLTPDAQLQSVDHADVKERPGGLYELQGKNQSAITSAGPGSIVAIARLEATHTGDTLSTGTAKVRMPVPKLLKSAFAMAVRPHDRADEAKLSQLIVRMKEEDPSIAAERAPFTDELVLRGHGEMHLTITVERMQRKYNVRLDTQLPQVPYRETIMTKTQQQGRYKHQTGGHGMFGDVHLEIQPLPRGSGIKFADKIVGGVVPKQFFPGVEKGVREALEKGPIGGYPVVDVGVTLYDGSYHNVDSNEASFKMAAALAMREGLPKCRPSLLEPIQRVEITVPSNYTSTVMQHVTGKRGQILSFGPSEGRDGWDTVQALVPQAEIGRYLTELRTASQGLGYFVAEHDHFEFAPPKVVQTVTESRREPVAAR
jgi:elongation factor G